MKIRLILAFLAGIFVPAMFLHAADEKVKFVEFEIGGKCYIFIHADPPRYGPETKEIPPARKEPLTAEEQTAANEALWSALKSLSLPKAKSALGLGADVNARNGDGLTPLMYACERGYVGVAVALIEHGADVNARNEDGLTPLMYACKRRYVDMAGALIEHGADVDAMTEDAFEKTALTFALENGCEPIAQMLRKRTKGPGPEDLRSLLNRPEHLAVTNALRDSGYFISPRMPLSQSVKDGLEKLFSDPGHRNSISTDFYQHATRSTWEMIVDICAQENTYSIHRTGFTMSIPRTIEALAKEILAYLPGGRYYVQVKLFDGFAKWRKGIEGSFRALDPSVKPSLKTLLIPPLSFHQDSFGGEKNSYNYLWFTLLKTLGISNNCNKLELGTALASDLNDEIFGLAAKVRDGRVQIIEAVEGIAGAGYFVDQSVRGERAIVHRHTGLKTVISNCPIDAALLRKHVFDDCKKSLGNKHNCLSPEEYEPPTRESLVVRITKLHPEGDASQAAAAQAD